MTHFSYCKQVSKIHDLLWLHGAQSPACSCHSLWISIAWHDSSHIVPAACALRSTLDDHQQMDKIWDHEQDRMDSVPLSCMFVQDTLGPSSLCKRKADRPILWSPLSCAAYSAHITVLLVLAVAKNADWHPSTACSVLAWQLCISGESHAIVLLSKVHELKAFSCISGWGTAM